jgi:hypothetical protein
MLFALVPFACSDPEVAEVAPPPPPPIAPAVAVDPGAAAPVAPVEAGAAFGPVPTGPIAQLSLGNDHGCVVTATGALACWSIPDPTFPLGNVPTGTFRSVHVGTAVSCALATDGHVACFGSERLLPSVPALPAVVDELCHDVGPCVRVGDVVTCYDGDGRATPLPGVVAGSLSCGGAFDCGLTAAGEVACVAADDVMAHGSEYVAAADVGRIPTGPFTAVVAGYQHVCALRVDGTVACWGHDVAGETWPPKGQFTRLALGEKRSCGLRVDGAVACWGLEPEGPWAGPFVDVGITDNDGPDDPAFVCGVAPDRAVRCWPYAEIIP